MTVKVHRDYKGCRHLKTNEQNPAELQSTVVKTSQLLFKLEQRAKTTSPNNLSQVKDI